MTQRHLWQRVVGVSMLAVLSGCAMPIDEAEPIASVEQSLTTCGGFPANGPDGDADGIHDGCEQWLAERFAPIIYHSSDESNYPTSVDWFLPKTTLRFYDDGCTPDVHHTFQTAPAQWQLLGWWYQGGCGSSDTVFSSGTRSDEKERTFYLTDVASGHRGGSSNTQDWKTYVHAYRNIHGGITVQYWRFYAYNNAINDHGGDWEGIHVALNSALAPHQLVYLQHSTFLRLTPSQVVWEGNHPRVFSEGGGHASRPSGSGIQARCRICDPFCRWTSNCTINPNNPDTFVRQETFPEGTVWGYNRPTPTPTGPLVNVGEKLAPLNGQGFIQYSGIWGSPGTFEGTSGYWGPAFNETGMGAGRFITAWCDGIASFNHFECHPHSVSR